MLLLGGQNVGISLVLAMFLKRHVFRRCVLNEFRSRFQWKIVCSGGAQELKTVEILVRKWYLWFSLFFREFGIQRNVRKQWKFKVHLTLPTVAKRWFSLPRDGRHVKIEVFQESLRRLPGKHFGGFRGRWKREKGCRRGSSGALWNVWARPKTWNFITIQARERLRQDVKWTCIFRQNTVFIAILAPNGFRGGIWKKWQKFEVHMALLAKAF